MTRWRPGASPWPPSTRPDTATARAVRRTSRPGPTSGRLWRRIEAARRITVPIQFLLPWDDEHVDRQSALALFDAFASTEKTLHANPGDHRTIRWIGLDDEFLARHLGRAGTLPA
jgi:hypothetical protein